MATVHALSHDTRARRQRPRTTAAAEPRIDWSRLAFLGDAGAAHALKVNTQFEAQAALLILKTTAGDRNPFVDESTDGCARGLIQTQYRCVTRELIVRHVLSALGSPTETSICTVLRELKAEGWPVRLV